MAAGISTLSIPLVAPVAWSPSLPQMTALGTSARLDHIAPIAPMPFSLPRSHAVACFRSYPMCAIAPVWHVQQQTIQCSKLPPQWAPMQIRLRLRRSPGSHAGLLGHRLCGGGKWCVRSVVPAACLPRVHPMCGAITRLCRRSRPLGHDRVQATAHGPEELARGAAWPRASPSSSCASLSLSLSLMCAAPITVCVPHARLCLMSCCPAPSCRFAVTGTHAKTPPFLQVCGDRLLTSHDPAEARLLDGEIVLGWARQALAAIEAAAVAALKSEPQFQAGR